MQRGLPLLLSILHVAAAFPARPDLAAAEDLTVSFDWTVPARLGAKDPDGKLH